MHNAISWFEIPARDLSRAGQFYNRVLGKPLLLQRFGPDDLLVFRYEKPGVGGCVLRHDSVEPSPQGVIIYLVVETLDAALQRAQEAGGTVATPRTELPEGMGYYAHIIDSEGNRIGLHAMN